MSNAEALTSQSIVALCDIDFKFVDRNIPGKLKDKDGKKVHPTQKPEGLLARVLLRFVFLKSGSAIDETALNAALIAALVGNFLGRDIHIALCALPLVGGSFANLSSRAQ